MNSLRFLCLSTLAFALALPAYAVDIPNADKARKKWQEQLDKAEEGFRNTEKAFRGSLKQELKTLVENVTLQPDLFSPEDVAATGYGEIGTTFGAIYLAAQNAATAAIADAKNAALVSNAFDQLGDCVDAPPCALSGDSRKFAIAVSLGRGGAWDDFTASLESRLATSVDKIRKLAKKFTKDLRSAAKKQDFDIEVGIGVRQLPPRFAIPIAATTGKPAAPTQVTVFLAVAGDSEEVRVQGLGTPGDNDLELEYFVLDSATGTPTSALDEVAAPVNSDGRWTSAPAGLDPGVYRIELRRAGLLIEGATTEFQVF